LYNAAFFSSIMSMRICLGFTDSIVCSHARATVSVYQCAGRNCYYLKFLSCSLRYINTSTILNKLRDIISALKYWTLFFWLHIALFLRTNYFFTDIYIKKN
jgi:hypothetical protein